MTRPFGIDALPDLLADLMEPWARALEDVDRRTADDLLEAATVGAAWLDTWVVMTPLIAAATEAARAASVRLANAFQPHDDPGRAALRTQAVATFERLVAALGAARPTEEKSLLGLDW